MQNSAKMTFEFFCLLTFILIIILAAVLWFGPFELTIDDEEEY